MGGPELIKGINRQRILQAIRTGGPLSRAEVADRTGLTRPTVSSLVAELIEEGWVEEIGHGVSSGGRRPILLRFNPAARLAIGAELSAGHVRAVLCDLEGRVLARHKERVTTADPATALQRVVAAVRAMQAAAPAQARLAGVGFGVTGVVDRAAGLWLGSPHFPGPPQPAGEVLASATGLPVVVENDARCLALGEVHFGTGRHARCLVAVRVGVAIGAGIVLDGQVYAGPDGGAGELGHVAVDPDGPVCACGRRGCLEAVAAARAIARAALERVQAGQPSVLAQRLAGGVPDPTITSEVIAAAAEGDAVAREVLAQAGRAIGVAVGNLINLLNPDLVVVGGGTSRAGAWLLDPLRRAALERALPVHAQRVRIAPAWLGEESVAAGAAALITAPLLAPPSLDGGAR